VEVVCICNAIRGLSRGTGIGSFHLFGTLHNNNNNNKGQIFEKHLLDNGSNIFTCLILRSNLLNDKAFFVVSVTKTGLGQHKQKHQH